MNLKATWRLAILLILGITTGCTAPDKSLSGAPGVERLQKLAGNQLELIRSPDSVTIQRIETNQGAENSLTEAQPLTGQQLKALQTLLLNENSYGWDYAKDCTLLPGILIVFSKGSDQLEVRLCYECVMIGFHPGSWGNFDPIENELISWAKTTFPNDEVISGLEAKSNGGDAR